MTFFDYHLPEELIAQHPVACRDESRLLVVRRVSGQIEHFHFRDLPDLLSPRDVLVLNDTKVIPARLVGRREKTGGKWEGLFLRLADGGLWEMLAQTRGHPDAGEYFATDPGPLRLRLHGRTSDRHWLMEPEPPGDPYDLLCQFGQIPLPPYIRKGRGIVEDNDRYQTVFAQHAGSVAAPTAGLHFTPELLTRLTERGIEHARVTLHVGLGTFEPVKVEDPAEHRMHAEWCVVPAATVETIANGKARGGRVVAVGTTTTRTLESAARDGVLQSTRGETDLYIRPPYEFKAIDALITNFHLPRTTLLLLVGAFVGPALLRAAYDEAICQRYRFYSYGDAMLVL